jgi:hypothetical protein
VVSPAVTGFPPKCASGMLISSNLRGREAGGASCETLRGWTIEDGLWTDRRHRLASPRQPRDYLGELVQIDGSEHAWFETRGETCTLSSRLDDARFIYKISFDSIRSPRCLRLKPIGTLRPSIL